MNQLFPFISYKFNKLRSPHCLTLGILLPLQSGADWDVTDELLRALEDDTMGSLGSLNTGRLMLEWDISIYSYPAVPLLLKIIRIGPS